MRPIASRSSARGRSRSPPKSRRRSRARLLGGARGSRQAPVRNIVRADPGIAGPALLVIIGETLVGERDHPVIGARAARIEQRLDADVLVVAGVVDFVELVPAAELGPDRIPQELHDLDALAIADVVRAAHIFRQILVDRWILEIPG